MTLSTKNESYSSKNDFLILKVSKSSKSYKEWLYIRFGYIRVLGPPEHFFLHFNAAAQRATSKQSFSRMCLLGPRSERDQDLPGYLYHFNAALT